MSINGFNPNSFMSTMMPTQSMGMPSTPATPFSMPANASNAGSTLPGSQMSAMNSGDAISQLFTMLASLLSQMMGSAGGTTPGQQSYQTPANPPQQLPVTSNYAANTPASGDASLEGLSTLLQNLVRELTGQGAEGTGGGSTGSAGAPYPQKEEAVQTPAGDKTAPKTGDKVASNNGQAEKDGVVNNVNNEAGGDLDNINTTITDSGNTYNIHINRVDNKQKGQADKAKQKPAPDKGNSYGQKCDTPAADKPKPETPTYEKPAPEKPKPETPTYEKPAPEKPKPETPTYEKPAPEKPKPNKPTPNYQDNNGSKYYGDPHFVGFGGEKYDVMGEAGKTYNILSDKDLQYNGKFVAWDKKPGSTVIGEAGITSGKDQLEYKLGDTPKLNGKAMEKGKDYTLDAGGKAKWDGSKMHYENNEYNIDLSRDPENKDAILSNVKVKDGANPLADGVAAHGLLGQTADGVKGERVGKNADGSKKTDKNSDSKQGGTVIDGSYKDYEVKNLLDIAFSKNNQFAG